MSLRVSFNDFVWGKAWQLCSDGHTKFDRDVKRGLLRRIPMRARPVSVAVVRPVAVARQYCARSVEPRLAEAHFQLAAVTSAGTQA